MNNALSFKQPIRRAVFKNATPHFSDWKLSKSRCIQFGLRWYIVVPILSVSVQIMSRNRTDTGSSESNYSYRKDDFILKLAGTHSGKETTVQNYHTVYLSYWKSGRCLIKHQWKCLRIAYYLHLNRRRLDNPWEGCYTQVVNLELAWFTSYPSKLKLLNDFRLTAVVIQASQNKSMDGGLSQALSVQIRPVIGLLRDFPCTWSDIR